jgi:hypothetical protein
LGVITGSTAFATTQYSINPGQAASFPWLSLEAKQWEKYRIRKLCYEYTPQVTEFSTNGVGSLVIGFDADASDAPPNDLVHALNCDPRAFDLPCKRIVLDIPPKYMNMMTDGYFVRPGNLPGQSDIKTYDCGNINISTVGQANAGQIGILAVSYVVEFSIPILEPTVGAPANNTVSLFQSNNSEAVATSNVTQNVLFATTTLNGLNVVNTAGSFVCPAGNYLIDVTVNAYNSSSDLIYYKLDLKYNGVSQFTSTTPELLFTGGETNAQLTFPFFLACDGVKAFTVPTTATFTGGSEYVSGMIRITAV